jgi:pyruvate/2-oxoglutarate dehydrogenase complex dihydrolipoamide dehydrogenase (E3) component
MKEPDDRSRRCLLKVAVVERRCIGGSCPNIACMPGKNEIWSARIAYLTQHAAQFGTITGPVVMAVSGGRYEFEAE